MQFTTVCAWCDRVERDGGWKVDPGGKAALEETRTASHGLCPACFDEQIKEFERLKQSKAAMDSEIVRGGQGREIEDLKVNGSFFGASVVGALVVIAMALAAVFILGGCACRVPNDYGGTGGIERILE